MPDLIHTLTGHFNFICYVILLQVGLFAMIAKRNLVKKLIGMSIFSSAVILFFVSLGVNNGGDMLAGHNGKPVGNIPVLGHDIAHAAITNPNAVDPTNYANPLPHVLMLTAIVVGVATLGVGLALVQRIYQDSGSLEENEILEQARKGEND